MNIFVTGPAGSGKSTFVKNYGAYLVEKDYKTCLINLDSASDPIYTFNANIRDFVKTEELMAEYRLGFNGALLKSIEITLKYLEDVTIDSECDFTLFDTPGQLEIFLYSKYGEKLIEKIKKSGASVGVFLVDSEVASSPENFISILAQCTSISLRTALPVLTLFNKSDLKRIDISLDIIKEKIYNCEGVLSELMEVLLSFLQQSTAAYRPINVSSVTGEGFDEVFSAINEMFCECGDIS